MPAERKKHKLTRAAVLLAIVSQPLFGSGTDQSSVHTEFMDSAPDSASMVEKKAIKEFTIQNFIEGLADANLLASFEITVTDYKGGVHRFFCRTDYESCLWYPPDTEEYPGAADINLGNLNEPLRTGTTIKLLPDSEDETSGFLINEAIFEAATTGYGDVSFNLQNPDYRMGEYLKGGATFEIENHEDFLIPQKRA